MRQPEVEPPPSGSGERARAARYCAARSGSGRAGRASETDVWNRVVA